MTNGSSRSHRRPPVSGIPNERLVGNSSGSPKQTHPWIETDGGERERPERTLRREAERSIDGTADGDKPELVTYTNETYEYSVDYPASWSVDTDARGGATFEDRTSTAGAVVSIDENVGTDVAAYAERFQESLAADEHVHDLTLLDRQAIRLPSTHRGRVIECAYVGGAPDERWRLTYLFVVANDTGYTVGMDWDADADFEEIARIVIDSFTLATDSTE